MFLVGVLLMALEFAHGAIQWLESDTAGATYTVSGLSFQPKALRFYTCGMGSATDAANATNSLRWSLGFAASTSDRRCVCIVDANGQPTSVCASGYRDDCVAITIGAAAFTGQLDLTSINSDGFVLTVDLQLNADETQTTVFWEAWGGSDITVAATGEIAEPAATGDQDYTVTGFTSGATNQVVMLAGVQHTGAVNAMARSDAGFFAGFAAGTATADNIVACGNSDDATASMDTDGYCQTDECLAMILVAGGNPSARAVLTQFGTNNFRLNWIARGTTDRKSIFLAIKGGQWTAGSLTLNGNTLNANATVSGLAYAPEGACLISRRSVEQTAGTSAAENILSLGTVTGTGSRRTMGSWSEFATASSSCEVNSIIEYDQVIAFADSAGAAAQLLDVDQWNSDGFRVTVDAIGGVSAQWVGYLAFGDAAAVAATSPPPRLRPWRRWQRRG